IAKSVARRTGTLFAGDICNTNIYDPADKASVREVERIYHEQVGWAVEAGVDYFVAETIGWIGEALMALEAIKKYSKVPAVVTLDPFLCTRGEIFDFGREAYGLGIRYLGVCCGAGPHHIRALAESLGRHPPASRYSVDMSRHAFFGTDQRIRKIQSDYVVKL